MRHERPHEEARELRADGMLQSVASRLRVGVESCETRGQTIEPRLSLSHACCEIHPALAIGRRSLAARSLTAGIGVADAGDPHPS